MDLSESYDGIAAEVWDQMGGDEVGEDLAFFARHIPQGQGPALDLTCGSGRHLLRLLQMGYEVEGVDASPTMLKNCMQKGKQAGLEPTLYRQSMQKLDLPRRYQTIYISQGSFQLLWKKEDVQETLSRCHQHLNPGGKLIVETFLPSEWCLDNWDTTVKEWAPTIRPRDGATISTYVWTESSDRNEKLKVEKRRYEATLNGRLLESELHTMHLHWYLEPELTLLLEQSGFSTIQRFSDYNESPATPTSTETIFIATRSA